MASEQDPKVLQACFFPLWIGNTCPGAVGEDAVTLALNLGLERWLSAYNTF